MKKNILPYALGLNDLPQGKRIKNALQTVG
jgi:hypothetical protein